ncbi:hypothetical protein [Alicyclobacillus sp. ALC3]|uniref:hypothetical protein n=1 Tax=Alicyclobacillus sp. ALC3 TaxID=2796143 RepID=UPI0023791003|nr:hypothetical protein [Alicyclobacillus sp. ALC3]WDL97770.1 hypothetical protein JC200_03290 [Alicyclobacillus sp. ALC3]
MYLAELHGKLSRKNENKEDILTSNVFSFLKYAPRDLFLQSFLIETGLTVDHVECQEAGFLFWPTYGDKTEPDVVIIVGKYYLLIEAKYFSDFGKEHEKTPSQLVREIAGGQSQADEMGLQFVLVAITADYYYRSEKFTDIPAEFIRILKWTNWQTVARVISSVLDSEVHMNSGVRLMAEDLYALLVRKNLRSYQGISLVDDGFATTDNVFFRPSSRSRFTGFKLLHVSNMNAVPQTIFHSHGRRDDSPAATSIRIAFGGFERLQASDIDVVPQEIFHGHGRRHELSTATSRGSKFSGFQRLQGRDIGVVHQDIFGKPRKRFDGSSSKSLTSMKTIFWRSTNGK